MTETPPGGGAGRSSGAIRFVMPADTSGATGGLPADAASQGEHPAGGSPPRLARIAIGGVTDSRIAAADVLADLRGGELLDATFDRRAGRLDARDRRWTQELVYGMLRRRAWIDALLLTRVRGGLARLDADVTDLLRLGAYQLLYMGSVPAYAAIAQTVELTKQRHGIGASRLANAVLRRLDRERADAPSAVESDAPTDPLDALALRFSHPRWLIARWVARWGAEEAAALLSANNAEAPVVLRPYGIVREQLEAMLEAAGVQHEEAPFVRDSIQLRVTPALTELGAYRQGLFFVQDPAATLVTQYACVAPGSLVADLCAAPGGKSLELSRTASLVVAAAARCAVHRYGHLPSPSGRPVAPQAIGPCRHGIGAARAPPSRGADRSPGWAADLLDMLARDRGERRANRELPRRPS
jgi:transcription termination factor NusB